MRILQKVLCKSQVFLIVIVVCTTLRPEMTMNLRCGVTYFVLIMIKSIDGCDNQSYNDLSIIKESF